MFFFHKSQNPFIKYENQVRKYKIISLYCSYGKKEREDRK